MGTVPVGEPLPVNGAPHCTACAVWTMAPSLFVTAPVGTVSVTGLRAHHATRAIQDDGAAEEPLAPAVHPRPPTDMALTVPGYQSWSV